LASGLAEAKINKIKWKISRIQRKKKDKRIS
jgi:hypothetical protein